MVPGIQPNNEAKMMLPSPSALEATATTVRGPEETAATAATTTKAPPTHECEDCGKVFKQASNLRTHLKVHGKSAREFFLCSLCGKHFQYKNSLLVHLGTHQFHINSSSKVPEGTKRCENSEDPQPIRGVEGHECSFCLRRFAFKSDLEAHRNALHTRERSFGCKECPKKFYHRSSLRVHIRASHGDRKKCFECSQCGARMSDASNLRAHERIHSGERPFQCPKCARPFARSSDLRQHLLVHEDKPSFKCSVCGKGFRSRKGWKKHERNAHSVVPVESVNVESRLLCLDE